MATKRDQAKRVYEEMRRMIFINPNLNKILKVKRDKIEFIHNNSFFQPLSSETKTLDGLNPYFVVLDGSSNDGKAWHLWCYANSNRKKKRLFNVINNNQWIY
ncbi:terminase large subunit domain-containing protein [Spiroplasma citri]|uniref:terminase large subunit domain-containing protein n=1 Tax=Spiroplasma citri TaxID=2133 RepID=UPI0020A29979|nr:terminase large subunit [Spiroplasma citri]